MATREMVGLHSPEPQTPSPTRSLTLDPPPEAPPLGPDPYTPTPLTLPLRLPPTRWGCTCAASSTRARPTAPRLLRSSVSGAVRVTGRRHSRRPHQHVGPTSTPTLIPSPSPAPTPTPQPSPKPNPAAPQPSSQPQALALTLYPNQFVERMRREPAGTTFYLAADGQAAYDGLLAAFPGRVVITRRECPSGQGAGCEARDAASVRALPCLISQGEGVARSRRDSHRA